MEQWPASIRNAYENDVDKKLSKDPLIHPSALILKSHIGAWTEVGSGWIILESIFGDYTYAAGSDGQICYTEIGKFCSLASHVVINPGDHPLGRVTQHHCTYRRRQYSFAQENDEAFFHWRRERGCRLGHDVWIGHGAMIMSGITIGTGAVIGAGSVVTHDVAPYEIVVGAPARPIRKRFPDDIVERLLASSWWEWDWETLRERMPDLCDIHSFLEKYC